MTDFQKIIVITHIEEVKDAYGLPVSRITHRQHPNDLAMSRWYAERLLEIADAAGAAEKWVALSFTEEDQAMKGSSHLHGTCRMGDDPARSVVDPLVQIFRARERRARR